VIPAAFGGEWMVAVQHREGSLEAAVDSFRVRNLGVSLGVLALLAAALAMIVVSTRRSQRLAELQMGFVAGVSHELRTPLAVIRSAADNLADGLISSEDQVRKYGSLIRDEGRRLTDMVEQTLAFASAQSGRREYKSERIDAAELIESVAKENADAAAAAGFTVETNIAPGLQPVRGDAAALRQCVSNLLRNAFKYGGDQRWAALSAQPGNGETIIRVEDRGIGIEPADLPHVFEPFYRGRQASENQTPGSGLGLSLARDAVEAMGGRLSVESRVGRGSVFSLSLPVSQAEHENKNPAD
jgi:signal transduction histidine kinase